MWGGYAPADPGDIKALIDLFVGFDLGRRLAYLERAIIELLEAVWQHLPCAQAMRKVGCARVRVRAEGRLWPRCGAREVMRRVPACI